MPYSTDQIALRDTDPDVVATQQRIYAEIVIDPSNDNLDADMVSWREITLYEQALALTAEPLTYTREQTAAALQALQQFAAAEMRCSGSFFAKFNDVLAPFQAELDALGQSGH